VPIFGKRQTKEEREERPRTRIRSTAVTVREGLRPVLSGVKRGESYHGGKVLLFWVVKGEFTIEDEEGELSKEDSQQRTRMQGFELTRVPTAQMSHGPANLAALESSACSAEQ
jgi:hypothetical protein